jgi:hypothetical protein
MPSPGVAVSVNDSAAGKIRGRRARPLASNPPIPAPADETEQTLELWFTLTPAVGVESNRSWPCGQDSQPKPECHRRRDLRLEARGGGYRF